MSRLEFLEGFLGNNLALSDAEGNTSGPLNRGGLADLPLLGTLLAIHQKFWEPGALSNGLFCFISMCKYDSFKNSFATITRLSEPYLDLEDTIEISKAWPDNCNERYIHQFQSKFTQKIY